MHKQSKEIFSEFASVHAFEGLGCIQEAYHIDIDKHRKTCNSFATNLQVVLWEELRENPLIKIWMSNDSITTTKDMIQWFDMKEVKIVQSLPIHRQIYYGQNLNIDDLLSFNLGWIKTHAIRKYIYNLNNLRLSYFKMWGQIILIYIYFPS